MNDSDQPKGPHDLIGRRRVSLDDTTRQCTATSRHSGQRCKRYPIPGGFVCKLHGGGSPQVKQAARERLAAMVHPALDVLLRALRMGTACDHCGRADDMGIVVKAAQLVLDRTGFGPHSTVSAEVTTTPGWHTFLTDEQLSTIATWIAEAKARMADGERPAPTTTVTVIEPGSPVDKFQQSVLAKRKELEAREREAQPRPVLSLVRQNAWADGTPGREDEE